MSTVWVKALCLSVVGVLSACGGGGNAVVPEPAVSWNVSGTLAVAENSAVDSDTNDANQTERRANNDFPTAQPLVTPFLLLGTVNQPGAGAAGANQAAGDVLDGYRVSLQPGQVVELEFSGDPAQNDLDLYVYDETATGEAPPPIGESVGLGPYECVRITRAGQHYIAVTAYQGASSYQLRVGAPSETSSCVNAASSLSGMVPGQVVAKPKTGAENEAPGSTKMRQVLSASALEVLSSMSAQVPGLLRMPTAAARGAALQRLGAFDSASASTQRRTVLGAVPAVPSTDAMAAFWANAPHMPAALRDVVDTVHYAKHLMRTGQFAYAEPNRWVRLADAAPTLVGAYPPNDRLYPNQRWHYEMIGLPTAMGRLVSLPTPPTVRPLVAVIDSGIVADHPDLAAQVVDGRSFLSGSSMAGADDPSSPLQSSGFHGTHVAGTIAAVTFDGLGVAGVAPMAQLMPLRVLEPGANASNFDIAQAILYAAGLDNLSGVRPVRRADVINLSLGGGGACSATFSDVIDRARAAGTLVVASVGNDAAGAINSPANCTGVIAVGAVDARRARARYSNTGAGLSLLGPGGDASQSTTGTGLPDSVYSTMGDFDANGARIPGFGAKDGTSMAAPHVAGVLALMRFAYPALTVAQVDTLLARGRLSDDLGPSGYDSSHGWGLINARKAVDQAVSLAGGAPAPALLNVVRAQPSSLDFGSLRTRLDLVLRVDGPTTERVVSIASSLAAVTVVPKSVSPLNQVGTYSVVVDRSALPEGSSFATLHVNLIDEAAQTRQIAVSVSVYKAAPGTRRTGDYGPVYVVALDPDTGHAVAQTTAWAVDGRYQWRLSGVPLSRVQIMASTDLDNDGRLCQGGEACAAYPVFGPSASVIELTADREGLNFDLAPMGGGGTGFGTEAVGTELATPLRVLGRLGRLGAGAKSRQ